MKTELIELVLWIIILFQRLWAERVLFSQIFVSSCCSPTSARSYVACAVSNDWALISFMPPCSFTVSIRCWRVDFHSRSQ